MKETDQLISVFSGHGVKKFFSNEIGIQKWQRIPPTESKGRVHTSTISVAVLDEQIDSDYQLNMNDVEFFYTRGSGNGGQHKNTTNSCVIVRHISGIEVRIDGRNQHKNKKDAILELKKRLGNIENNKKSNEYNSIRNEQIDYTNNRSNSRRTYNVKTGVVKDNITGKKASLKKIMKGHIDLLHGGELEKNGLQD